MLSFTNRMCLNGLMSNQYVLTCHAISWTHGISFWSPCVFPGFGPPGSVKNFHWSPVWPPVFRSELVTWPQRLLQILNTAKRNREINLKARSTVCYKNSSGYSKYKIEIWCSLQSSVGSFSLTSALAFLSMKICGLYFAAKLALTMRAVNLGHQASRVQRPRTQTCSAPLYLKNDNVSSLWSRHTPLKPEKPTRAYFSWHNGRFKLR